MAVEAEALEAPEPPEWEDWKAAHARPHPTAAANATQDERDR